MARTAAPARQFVSDFLKTNPSATAAEGVAAAKAKNIKLSTAYFYVLRSSLGGSRRTATPGRRRASRSTSHAGNGIAGLEQIQRQLEASHRYHAALEQIARILGTTL